MRHGLRKGRHEPITPGAGPICIACGKCGVSMTGFAVHRSLHNKIEIVVVKWAAQSEPEPDSDLSRVNRLLP